MDENTAQHSPIYAKFESEIPVRPDDIDMNNHVHSSKYFDYVLAARFDQMDRFYKMSMEEFLQRGFGWVITGCSMKFRRSLFLGDIAIVRTQITRVKAAGVDVQFEILRKATNKLCVEGMFEYTMVNVATQKAEIIPADIKEKYSI